MKKILLGLSGGVDSAVAASVLTEQGFNVTGCFLLLTENSDEHSQEACNARKVAEHLGIELIFSDYRQRFKEFVSDFFINEYLSGRTPNPCVRCNPTVKIFSLCETADKLGIEAVATGHYAITEYSEAFGGKVIKPALSKKDQSYFLGRLTPAQIDRLTFPLGSFASKEEVRAYALRLNLPNAKKSDSQEICFIPDNDYGKYISARCPDIPESGNLLDNDGKIIGKHTGIINYTVGQRKGLGAFGEPRYVKNIDAAMNTVTICKKNERYSSLITADDVSFAIHSELPENFEGKVKIRSTATPADATIKLTGNSFTAEFASPVLAPCPGQAAVIYINDTVVACGTIR